MKYKLTTNTKQVNDFTVYQIEALIDIPSIYVKKGNLGGWIEKEANLSQERNAWVSGDARVYGNAKIEKTSDYMTISSLGNSCRTITITFADKMIVAGCFRGNLDEFKQAIDKKYNGKGNYYPTIKYIAELFGNIN